MTDKSYREGMHRTVAPSVTLERVLPHLDSFGITRVANITGLDRIGVPVFAVYRPNARSVSVSQGKGMNDLAAKVSGIMEGVEIWHAEHIKKPLRLASYSEISEEVAVINVESLPAKSSSRFHDHMPILWIAGKDLSGDDEKWVPYESVHSNFTLPLPSGSGNFQISTNGLASGNTWFEAVSHAISEVVERDCMALWALRGGPSNPNNRLDLTTVRDPDCCRIIEMLEAGGQAVGVWSVTSDIGLPTFACVMADRTLNHLGRHYYSEGSGCHVNREIALLRALTEAAQTRLTFISGARDDAHRDVYLSMREPERVNKYLTWIDKPTTAPSINFGNVPTFETDSFEADVELQIDLLRAVGLREVVTVDLDGRIPSIEVVKVIIPGLEGIHDAPGYVVGRRAQAQQKTLTGEAA
ncbi:YcaO-like family protein [Pseudovibrio sp. Ad26]|uniref:YcaO-like family protein n=1 Tax=Pseudovibrio sp. Ad26 TaxID=989410 RepID=UPI0007AE3CFC|nr:YcaO-like family protein [Pseudovibrio sp. Ad26]KZL16539.1 YcaO-like family protein [Pseudovibrio sp. Ad26]